MGNPRVHEVAEELGVTAKEVMDALEMMGEFVKSPSSSLSPPVARKVKSVLATRAARRSLLERKPTYPKRAPQPVPRPVGKRRRQPPQPSPERVASLESRAAAAAESRRLYEEEAAARRAADEASGRFVAPSKPQEVQPKKRRWVKSVFNAGLPGLGKRR